MSTLLTLCLQFMKIGLFAIGGGLATLPFLYELGSMTGWFDYHDVLNMLAISESTPGPIGVNMATYVGYTVSGWYGAILATLSLALPSFIIILIVAKILQKIKSNKYVEGTFYMLRPASTALIAAAGFNVLIAVLFDVEKLTFDMLGSIGEYFTHINWLAIPLMIAIFIAMRIFKKVHPIFFVLIGAAFGIILQL